VMAEFRLSTVIYQLRKVLTGISPIIWRRLLVSSETTIAQLHQYIRVSFDWRGSRGIASVALICRVFQSMDARSRAGGILH
jgi:hypothetical protein